jgi:hypothetical protein
MLRICLFGALVAIFYLNSTIRASKNLPASGGHARFVELTPTFGKISKNCGKKTENYAKKMENFGNFPKFFKLWKTT